MHGASSPLCICSPFSPLPLLSQPLQVSTLSHKPHLSTPTQPLPTYPHAHNHSIYNTIIATLACPQTASSECPTGVDIASLPGPRIAGLPAQLLHKEAVYTACTAAAYELHDYVDWGGWLRGALLPELSDATPACRPLQRRAAMLVGAWVRHVWLP